ncbi:hypothetical protein Pcinc_018324 [Petrolisthes cinctipes]|uniref:Uncharacterized protein n=1 Tax=Petrolisthes cinctipes TaxID=88211 RepID=A0AAE1FME8_PETCI|nr:hypothetical protein Pcinc_018324 [Petrolisthes cinctipes]
MRQVCNKPNLFSDYRGEWRGLRGGREPILIRVKSEISHSYALIGARHLASLTASHPSIITAGAREQLLMSVVSDRAPVSDVSPCTCATSQPLCVANLPSFLPQHTRLFHPRPGHHQYK